MPLPSPPEMPRPRKFFSLLLAPIRSLMLAIEILKDGVQRLAGALRFSFSRGPISELGEYAKGIGDFLRMRGFRRKKRKRKTPRY